AGKEAVFGGDVGGVQEQLPLRLQAGGRKLEWNRLMVRVQEDQERVPNDLLAPKSPAAWSIPASSPSTASANTPTAAPSTPCASSTATTSRKPSAVSTKPNRPAATPANAASPSANSSAGSSTFATPSPTPTAAACYIGI